MRALRFHEAGDIRIDDVPRPDCGPGDVRLKVAYGGICGTDIHEYLAGPVLCPRKDEQHRVSGASLPQILGHEFSGTVIEIGRDVQGFQSGDRVCVNASMDDRHHGKDVCEFCQTGRHNICANSTFYGINAHGGGFAEEIVVRPESLILLPDSVSLKIAALAEPLAVAAHMVRISGFRAGQDAVVLGAGPIGCSLTFLLKDSGARSVTVSEVSSARAEQAKQCGADVIVNPTEEIVVDVVKRSMENGVDVAFEACGLQVTLETAIAITKPGGTIFNVAIHEKPVSIDMNLLTIPEKRIVAGNAYTPEDFKRVIDVLTNRGSDVERFITAIVPLESGIVGGFDELVKNKAQHNKILIEVNSEDHHPRAPKL